MDSFLFQNRPTDTDALVVLVPKGLEQIEINSIWVSEVLGEATTFSIFINRDILETGVKVFNEDNALMFNSPIEANQVINITGTKLISLDNPSTQLVIQVGTASSVNFTGFGNIT